MSKKDYILIAGALKKTMPEALFAGRTETNKARHQQWHKTTAEIVRKLQIENIDFNEEKFYGFMGIFIDKT